MEINKIYNEPNLETMSKMPDNFIDLTVTSPPYDGLRTYNGYSFSFEDIARELYRVTKEGGIVVWIVGDAVVDGGESGTSFRQAIFFQSLGFSIHDTMIYERSPAFPSSKDKSTRYSQSFEYMFVFSKGKPKTVNLICDRKNRWAGFASFGTQSERLADGTLKTRKKNVVRELGVRFNIWKYATGIGNSTDDLIAHDHPAIFPEQLAADHIYTWSNEGDLVYDCFGGSGTVSKQCILMNRRYILSEISKEYCELSEKRILPYKMQKNMFYD